MGYAGGNEAVEEAVLVTGAQRVDPGARSACAAKICAMSALVGPSAA